MSESILAKTARGAGWVIGWRMSTRVLGFANTLILARLLVPDDFGLVALATGFSQGIEALSALGIEEAVIRQKAATRDTYDTAFTINLIRGLLTAAVVAACAWPTAAFFRDPRLLPVLLALAGLSTVTAFENIGTIEFRRDFAFHREFKLLLLPRLASILATVAVALVWRSHWALVAGIATAQVLKTALGYAMHPYRPRLGLKAWRDLAGFSFWSWGISVAVMIRDRVDGFVIGRSLGLSRVGVYLVGVELAIMPTYEITGPLSGACFAGFAAAARTGADPSATYLRILASVLTVALPIGAGVSLVAEPAVLILFGPQWGEAVGVVRVLGFAATAYVLGTISASLLSAEGRLRPSFVINLLAMAVKAASVLLLVGPYGMIGAAVAYAVTLVFENGACLVVAFRRFGIGPAPFLARVWRGALATLAMAAVLAATGLGTGVVSPLVSLLEAVVVGGAAYAATLIGLWLLCGRPEGAETDLLELARRAAARGGFTVLRSRLGFGRPP